MKTIRIGRMLAAVMIFVAGITGLMAQEEKVLLTRAQWEQKIGGCVTDEAELKKTMALIPPEDQVEFVQRVMTAINALPVNPDEKAAAYVKATLAVMSSAPPQTRLNVMAEVFATVKVEFLPVVTEVLSSRFALEAKKMSVDAYQKIASDAVTIAAARNATTDEASVRNTFVVLAFLKGMAPAASDADGQKKEGQAFQNALVALLPTDQTRSVVTLLLDSVAADNNYNAVVVAAGVDPIVVSPEVIQQFIVQPPGVAGGDAPLPPVLPAFGGSGVTGDGQPDIGIEIVPKPYQNQGTTV